MISKRWTREYLPQWKQRSKCSRCSNTERRTCLDGRWFSETMWIQKWTSHSSLRRRRLRRTVSEIQKGIWITPQTGSEISASMVFQRPKTGLAMLAPLEISHKTAGNNFLNWKNRIFQHWKTVRTKKLKKNWNQKFVHPIFWEGKDWATRRYGTRLRYLLSCSWTQRTFWHQTHNCGYSHLCQAKRAFWYFVVFCQFSWIVNSMIL